VPDGGTYVLVLAVDSPLDTRVGALGTVTVHTGWVAYVGSACGPGGFARIDRHRRVATGAQSTRHWHIDWLLGHDAVSIADTVRFPGRAIECRVAAALDGGIAPGFGCSDCDCDTHLFAADDRAALTAPLAVVDRDAGPPPS